MKLCKRSKNKTIAKKPSKTIPQRISNVELQIVFFAVVFILYVDVNVIRLINFPPIIVMAKKNFLKFTYFEGTSKQKKVRFLLQVVLLLLFF